jgi:type I restriction enzyme S subunit
MWTQTTLGASCKMYQPKTISSKEMVADGNYVVFGANGIIGRYDQYNHAEPQLLVTCRGATCGSVNVSEPFSWINGNAMVIQPDLSQLSVRYMEYLFRGGIDLSKAITGAAQPQITRKSLEPIEFSYPSLDEQKRIVAKLDAAFAEIDKAVALLDVKETEIGKLKDSLLTDYLIQKLDDEEVSKTWKTLKLNDICENLDAKRIPITKKDRKSGEIPYYGASGIVDYVEGYIFDEELLLVSEDGANLLARTYPIAFSVIGKCWVNNHAHVLKFKDQITRRFVEYFLNFISLSDFVSGMAQPKLNQKKLNSIPISLPPIAEQQRLVSKVDRAFKEAEIAAKALAESKESYSALKSAILAQELQSEAA